MVGEPDWTEMSSVDAGGFLSLVMPRPFPIPIPTGISNIFHRSATKIAGCGVKLGGKGGTLIRQPIAVSDISVYICLIDIRDGSCKPVYGGVDHLQALSSAKTGHRSCFFMN